MERRSRGAYKPGGRGGTREEEEAEEQGGWPGTGFSTKPLGAPATTEKPQQGLVTARQSGEAELALLSAAYFPVPKLGSKLGHHECFSPGVLAFFPHHAAAASREQSHKIFIFPRKRALQKYAPVATQGAKTRHSSAETLACLAKHSASRR